MDPWYDYLAFPVAPLVLLGQFLALFSRRWRRVVSAVGTVAVFAMLSLVSVLPSGEGADIGEGLLLFWLLVDLLLLGVAFLLPKPTRSGGNDKEQVEVGRREV